MYLSISNNQVKVAESVLRDHNLHHGPVHLPVVGGVQLVNIRDDQIAKNVIHRLKSLGVTPGLTSTV